MLELESIVTQKQVAPHCHNEKLCGKEFTFRWTEQIPFDPWWILPRERRINCNEDRTQAKPVFPTTIISRSILLINRC